MLKALGSRLTYANTMATVAVFLALGGGAYALSGIPDRSGVYHGCVSNATGVLRVVRSASSCQKPKTVRRNGKKLRLPGEFAVVWNQKGQPGTNGLNGINAINGATNLIVRSEVQTAGAGNHMVPCNPGERAVSGGAARSTGIPTTGDSIDLSAPAIVQGGASRLAEPGESPNAWASGITASSVTTFVFYAVCTSP